MCIFVTHVIKCICISQVVELPGHDHGVGVTVIAQQPEPSSGSAGNYILIMYVVRSRLQKIHRFNCLTPFFNLWLHKSA